MRSSTSQSRKRRRQSSIRLLQRIPGRTLLISLLVAQILCLFLWRLIWPQPAPVELSFVTSEDEKVPWEVVIADFKKSHPNIHINLVTDPEIQTTDQREAIYRADFQADVARYDLVYMDSVWTAQFAQHLLDLRSKTEQRIPESSNNSPFLEGFLESDLTMGQYQQAIYRIPMRSDIGVLYYRKDLLEQIGQPFPPNSAISAERLENLVDVVQTDSNITMGYLWQGEAYEGLISNFVETVTGLGGSWINIEDGTVNLDSPTVLNAVKTMRRLIRRDISPRSVTDYNERDSLEAFKTGKALFLRGWPYFWSELKQTTLRDKVAIALPLSFSSNSGVGCRGGWGFGIPKNGSHPDEAWEAIQYFTSEPVQKKFVLASGYLPSRRSLFLDPDVVEPYPLMPQMLEYLEHSSVFRPSLQQYNAASKILQTALTQSLISEEDAIVEQAMAKAQRETQRLLDQEGS